MAVKTALRLRTLERAHDLGHWDWLGLPRDCTYAWFRRIQNAAEVRRLRPHTVAILLGRVYAVARHLPSHRSVTRVTEGDLQRAVAAAVRGVADPAGRRLTHAASVAWYTVHRVLAQPLPLPSSGCAGGPGLRGEPVVPDVAAMRRICEAADRLSPSHGCLLWLLFTTGLRIGAVSAIQWVHLWDGTAIRQMVPVREKGGRVRMVLLAEGLRARLDALRVSTAGSGPFLFGRVRHPDRPVGSRQLRDWWYAACRAAGLADAGYRPHSARHFVAHQLFAAHNPLAVIAKFLGHCSIETTNRYYLRLSFQEVCDRLCLPESLQVPPTGEGAPGSDGSI